MENNKKDKKVPIKNMYYILGHHFNLNWKLSEKGIFGIKLEGNSGNTPFQTNDIVRYLQNDKRNKINVLEIGFNAGHSAVTFLAANKNVHVTSFDIGIHDYYKIAKKYIDYSFPDRHNLIIGDSIKTIPEYHKNNPDKTFDILFIDGNHEYDYAMKDMMNCKLLANKDSLMILDDTTYPDKGQKITKWTEGPTLAFQKMVKDKEVKIVEICVYNRITCMSIGKYINL